MYECKICNEYGLDDEFLKHYKLFHNDEKIETWPDGYPVYFDDAVTADDFNEGRQCGEG